MWFRSLVEQNLELQEGEEYFDPKDREFIFRGRYFWNQKIKKVKSEPREDGGYSHIVVLEELGDCATERGGVNKYPDAAEDVVLRLNRQEQLNRANRVEEKARRIKGVALAAIAITVLAGGYVAGHSALHYPLFMENKDTKPKQPAVAEYVPAVDRATIAESGAANTTMTTLYVGSLACNRDAFDYIVSPMSQISL